MPDGSTLPPSGHNHPPEYRVEIVESHTAKAAEFLDAGGAWLDAAPITDETQAAKLADWISGVKAVKKTVDADRKADKKPHDDAGKAVQSGLYANHRQAGKGD